MNDKATPGAQMRPPADPDTPACAGLGRRLVSMFYESLLVSALLLLAAFAYLPILGTPQGPFQKAVFQLYLAMVLLGYFLAFWKRGGQTLAMKTWRIRLIAGDHGTLSTPLCVMRFALAFAGLLFAGLGFAWALVDREHQFLHDRILGTRLVNA